MKRKKVKNKTIKKSDRALIDAGKWIITYGIASITLSGISLVYLDIYSIATLNQSVNKYGDAYFVSFYLNIFLVLLLILGISFTKLGVSVLRKKISSNIARKRTGVAFVLALLSLFPLGSVILSFRGFSAIPILYMALFVLDIITIISILRFLMKKDDEEKPKKKQKSSRTKNKDYDDDML